MPFDGIGDGVAIGVERIASIVVAIEEHRFDFIGERVAVGVCAHVVGLVVAVAIDGAFGRSFDVLGFAVFDFAVGALPRECFGIFVRTERHALDFGSVDGAIAIVVVVDVVGNGVFVGVDGGIATQRAIVVCLVVGIDVDWFGPLAVLIGELWVSAAFKRVGDAIVVGVGVAEVGDSIAIVVDIAFDGIGDGVAIAVPIFPVGNGVAIGIDIENTSFDVVGDSIAIEVVFAGLGFVFAASADAVYRFAIEVVLGIARRRHFDAVLADDLVANALATRSAFLAAGGLASALTVDDFANEAFAEFGARTRFDDV